jgi:hypothetical protein
MAVEKKPSRKEYLVSQAKLLPKEQQNAAIQQINVAAKQKGGITKDKLQELNLGIERVLYGADALGGTAGAKPGAAAGTTPEVSAEEAAARAANAIENARLERERTDWVEYTTQVFNNYGLGTLAPKIKEYVQQGFTPDTVTLKLQETPEYQQRFAGNTARKKAGLPVLSPAEYLATESAYKQTMRSAGLPTGFYDDPSDFSTFIGVDVSPAELKSRVDIAAQTINGADPFFKQQLREYYNLGDGDMIAYALDPNRALSVIERQAQAVQFGAEATRQGISAPKSMAETYAGLGVTQQQARQGFEQVAEILPTAQRLSSITPEAAPVGLGETTSAVFGGEQSADYKQRIRRLSEIEQSRFAGQSGVTRGSLAQGTQGQF